MKALLGALPPVGVNAVALRAHGHRAIGFVQKSELPAIQPPKVATDHKDLLRFGHVPAGHASKSDHGETQNRLDVTPAHGEPRGYVSIPKS